MGPFAPQVGPLPRGNEEGDLRSWQDGRSDPPGWARAPALGRPRVTRAGKKGDEDLDPSELILRGALCECSTGMQLQL